MNLGVFRQKSDSTKEARDGDRQKRGDIEIIGKAALARSRMRGRWSSAWRRSGKRISEFAIENGLSAKRVYRWSARLEGGREEESAISSGCHW